MSYSRKVFIGIIVVFLFTTGNSFAIPYNLMNDEEGWLEVSIGYTYAIPLGKDLKGGHNFSFRCSIITWKPWGIGFGFRAGQSAYECTADIQYHHSLSGNLGIPLYLKAGFISPAEEGMSFGIGVESGLTFYFNEEKDIEQPQPDNHYEYNYSYLEGLGGVLISFRPRRGPPVVIIPAGTFHLGYATTPYPASGMYYSY